MRRSAVRGATVAAFMMIATLGTTTAALADSGDNQLACNSGEFCYSYDASFTYQKHFYYSGSDSNYTFVNIRNGAGTNLPVRDNAYAAKNRDTSCNFKVVDDRGFYPDDYQTIYRGNNWNTLIESVRNQNDRHERC